MFLHRFFLREGWYANPKNWKVNTAIIGAGAVAVAAWMFSVSADNEVCSIHPLPESAAVISVKLSLLAGGIFSPDNDFSLLHNECSTNS
jgi:hypothetical protein